MRVEKSSGTLYWRAYTGQVIEETNTSGGMQRDYIFPEEPGFRRRTPTPAKRLNFAGRRIAWKDSSGNAYYYFVDALGSTRAVTDSSGNVCFSADYYPGARPERSGRGQENAPCASRMALRDDYNTSCSPTYKFAPFASRMHLRDTGYEFDSETGNYYAGVYPDLFVGARYYNPRLGRPDAFTDTGRSALSEPDRFMSPDPLGGSVDDPQSLNGYAYVLNDPTTFTGPAEMPESFGALGSRGVSSPLQAIVSGLVAGGSGGGSAALAIGTAAAPQGQSALVAAPAQAGVTVASPTAVANAEAMLAEFVADYLSLRPSPSSPYGSGFSQACQGLSTLGNGGPSLQPMACSPYVPVGQTAEGVATATYFVPSGGGGAAIFFSQSHCCPN